MWHAADILEHVRHAPNYGYKLENSNPEVDWPTLKSKRDAYIKRLNGIYEKNLVNDKVEYITGKASFVGPNELEVAQRRSAGGRDGSGDSESGEKVRKLTAERICIAVGGTPVHPHLPGAELGFDSDGFFDLKEKPKRVAVVGAGYIAVELAGIFHTLGEASHFHL